MPYTKVCKWCNSTHSYYPYQCAHNTKNKKSIRRFGKTAQKHVEFRHDWIQKNATKSGTWECYLQIHEKCPRILTVATITLDHVQPKSGNPELRFEASNIRPACWYCNNKKGSKRLHNMV